MDSNTIVDHRPRLHINGLWRQYLEADPGRRDCLQIRRIGKERENFISAPREPLFAAEKMKLHRLVQIEDGRIDRKGNFEQTLQFPVGGCSLD